MIITGLRGVGKTVLLGKFRTEALKRNWVVVELEVAKNDDTTFRRDIGARIRTALLELSPKARWTDRLFHAAGVLRSFNLSMDPAGTWTASLGVDAATGYDDNDDLGFDLTDLFVAIGEAAQEKGRGVVLLLDEIQFLTRQQLEAVIQALHQMVQRKLPVTLVGAGLPQNVELAGDAKSYAERLFRFPTIGHLSPADAASALSEPARSEDVEFEPAALGRAVEVTGGYPYFLQELGYAVWTLAESSPIRETDVHDALLAYEAKLDESFFPRPPRPSH